MTSTLFDTAPFCGETKRSMRRRELQSLKAKLGAFTHRCNEGGWMALSMKECVEKLKGYSLTEEEKTDGFHLMAGYCRLLDEDGLIADGYKTELEAVKALDERIAESERKAILGEEGQC